ncbi:hypothetical protein LIER_27633 [Lithospermum erythrorhizon]|uniref:Uncharacterized protein n=1 Tax=Lithospermum erythrorhizon TaxID=34254 RepID=A0AAV3RES2_LITER
MALIQQYENLQEQWNVLNYSRRKHSSSAITSYNNQTSAHGLLISNSPRGLMSSLQHEDLDASADDMIANKSLRERRYVIERAKIIGGKKLNFEGEEKVMNKSLMQEEDVCQQSEVTSSVTSWGSNDEKIIPGRKKELPFEGDEEMNIEYEEKKNDGNENREGGDKIQMRGYINGSWMLTMAWFSLLILILFIFVIITIVLKSSCASLNQNQQEIMLVPT